MRHGIFILTKENKVTETAEQSKSTFGCRTERLCMPTFIWRAADAGFSQSSNVCQLNTTPTSMFYDSSANILLIVKLAEDSSWIWSTAFPTCCSQSHPPTSVDINPSNMKARRISNSMPEKHKVMSQHAAAYPPICCLLRLLPTYGFSIDIISSIQVSHNMWWHDRCFALRALCRGAAYYTSPVNVISHIC